MRRQIETYLFYFFSLVIELRDLALSPYEYSEGYDTLKDSGLDPDSFDLKKGWG